MSQLQIRQLSLFVPGRALLEEADLQVAQGEHLALVGPNGCGKSTLFSVLLGERQPDGGQLQWSRGIRVGSVAQEPPAGEQTPLEVVLQADHELQRWTAAAHQDEDPLLAAEAHHQLARIGADSAPARAAQLLAGLGFSEAMQSGACRELSGGWRGRVALAAALFAQPDLLLLDEPTNHLDLEATIWLTAFLKRYPGTLILISHDRALLNAVPNRIIHFDQHKLVSYRGGLDDFLQQREAKVQRLEAMQAKQMAQRERLQSFVDRFRAKASKARQAQSRMKALEKLPPVMSLASAESYAFSFPDPEPMGSPLLELSDVQAGYGSKVVLRDLNLSIQADDRIALLGQNGNGKTTLLRILSGRMAPQTGRLVAKPKLRIGYFSQHQTEEMPEHLNGIGYIRWCQPSWIEEQARGYLGRFGLAKERAETPIANLSGGEKARLLLAAIGLQKPHLLILDEPTNHLDMESVEALVEALNGYQGAVLLVTHETSLIERCIDTLWIVSQGTCKPFQGDLDDYRQACLQAKEGPAAQQREGTQRAQARREAAAQRTALAPLKAECEEAERKLQKWNADKAKLEQALADPTLYQTNPSKATQLQKQLAQLHNELEAAEMRWLELTMRYEQARDAR